MKLTPGQIDADPSLLAAPVETRQGQRFLVRPLEADDAEGLGIFLDALSDATGGVYRPHPLDADQARTLCSQIDRTQCLRFIALGPLAEAPESDTSRQICAYMILNLGVRDGEVGRYAEADLSLEPATTATFAPVVGDVWQERGLGSAMLSVLIEAARRLGRTQIVLMGGVRDDNPRARHFYTKNGFEWVRSFVAGGIDGHDMILRL